MRVVVIDDDEDLRFTTGLALKTGGFEPVPFASCDDAAAALPAFSQPPFAVLLDVHLEQGRIDPTAFIQWLRTHGMGGVPVLIVSGNPNLSEIAKAMGAQGYLTKPFNIAELMDQLAAVRKP
jgi:DNA-binding response OmpR family regulator